MKKIPTIFIFFIIILFSTPYFVGAETTFNLIYVVQQNDTLSEIAEEYNISTAKLREVNNINKGEFIRVGQELNIPKPEEQKKDITTPQLNPDLEEKSYRLNIGHGYSVRINSGYELPEVNIPEDKIIKYHVSRNDTLYDLARDLNTSIGVIMALNDMDSSIIRYGDVIYLPLHNLTPRQALAKVTDDQDVEILARAIFGEARGEPFIGQVAVGAVIINRVLHPDFPDTFRDVIYQPGQFSAVDDGQINLTPNNTAFEAANTALKGEDPTMGSLYYYNPKTAAHQWWFETRRSTVTIGDHAFAK